MPMTIRQFELGVGPQTEIVMQAIYGILTKDREHAYSTDDLLRHLADSFKHKDREQFDNALKALSTIGAIEAREIEGEVYYAFYRLVDDKTWAPIFET